jgi:fructose-1,6-bisphosphatase
MKLHATAVFGMGTATEHIINFVKYLRHVELLILSQTLFLKINFNIASHRCLGLPKNISVCMSFLSYVQSICPVYLILLDTILTILAEEYTYIMKLQNMQFSLTCIFFPL